ncbi:MAG TPA: FAD-dependent oxidoreductase [Acidimicrobiales bacterium]|nr:FAD-dependent oxidoreductase [Acidimicrobiales bacterium]
MDRAGRLFEPIAIGSMMLRNRVMMTVHGPRLSASRYLRYLDERSRDVALVGLHAIHGVNNFAFGPGRFVPSYAADFDVVAPHPLSADGRALYEQAVGMMNAQADVVHRNGAKAVGQILHLGASQHEENFQPVVGASTVQDEYRRHVPHPLTATEIADFVEAWAEAGRRAVRAGLDALEVHAAHGYLINQFLSPRTNTRTDRYGGDLDGRMRLLLEILEALRSAVGNGFPIGVRIPGREFGAGGLTVEEMCAIAQRAERWGVAYLNVSGGNYTGLNHGIGLAYVAPSYVPQGPNVEYAAAIRRATNGVPVIVAGRIVDLDYAESIIADGSVDMVGLTRALIADPRIVEKVRVGRADTVRKCVGGNECHYGRTVLCAVNPAAGREEELAIEPAAIVKNVLVVGGGPAGMECARVAASRGHRVRLIDDADVLGGTLRLVAGDPNRAVFGEYLDGQARRLADLDVDVALGRRMSAGDIESARADVVVLATGATDWVPPVPGAALDHVFTGTQVLGNTARLGRHVLVVGGLDDHLPPLTVADFVADGTRTVTLISEPVAAGQGVEAATLFALLARLLEKGCTLVPMSALHEVRADSVVMRNTLSNQLSVLDGVDTVVLVCGRRPRHELADLLQGKVPAMHLIGDCLSPRRLVHATLDGARQAVTI